MHSKAEPQPSRMKLADPIDLDKHNTEAASQVIVLFEVDSIARKTLSLLRVGHVLGTGDKGLAPLVEEASKMGYQFSLAQTALFNGSFVLELRPRIAIEKIGELNRLLQLKDSSFRYIEPNGRVYSNQVNEDKRN